MSASNVRSFLRSLIPVLPLFVSVALPGVARAEKRDMEATGVSVGGFVWPLPFPASLPTYNGGANDGEVVAGNKQKIDYVLQPSAKKLWYLDSQSRAGALVEGMWGPGLVQGGVLGEYDYGVISDKTQYLAGIQAGVGYASFSDMGFYQLHALGRAQVTGMYVLSGKSAVEATVWYGLFYPLSSKMDSGKDIHGGDFKVLGIEVGYLWGDLKKDKPKKQKGKKSAKGGKKGH